MTSTPPNKDTTKLSERIDARVEHSRVKQEDQSVRAPSREDLEVSQWTRTPRGHGEPRVYHYNESPWYSRPTPAASNLSHHPTSQPTTRHDHSPAYAYPYPPRPYFHSGILDHSYWGDYPEDQWRSPRPRPVRHWNESTSLHEQEQGRPSPSRYAYRPLYRSGEETPPRNNRNRYRDDAARHWKPSNAPDWDQDNQEKEGDQQPFQNESFGEAKVSGGRTVLLSTEEHTAKRVENPAISSPPSNKKFIFELRPYDVLCGRGVPNKLGRGNSFFKELVKKDQLEYISCRRNEKPPIATNIIEIIRDRGGRFLRRARVTEAGTPDRYAWAELPENRIYEKVCQALRDGAPQIRQRMLDLDSRKESSPSAGKENVRNVYTLRGENPWVREI